jgi:hypothetical protein
MSRNWKIAALLATATAFGTATPAHALKIGQLQPHFPISPWLYASWDDIDGGIFDYWGTGLSVSDIPGYSSLIQSFNNVFPFGADGYVGFSAEVGIDYSTAYARAYATLGGRLDIGPAHTGLQYVQYSAEPEVHKNGDSFTAAYGFYSWNTISQSYSVLDFGITSELHVDKNNYLSWDILPMQHFDLGTNIPNVGNVSAQAYANASASASVDLHTDLINGVTASVYAEPIVGAGFSFDSSIAYAGASVAPVGNYSKAEGTARVGEIRVVNDNLAYVCASLHGRALLNNAMVGGLTLLFFNPIDQQWKYESPFSYGGYTTSYPLDFERCATIHH